jgi:hypothetical protein
VGWAAHIETAPEVRPADRPALRRPVEEREDRRGCPRGVRGAANSHGKKLGGLIARRTGRDQSGTRPRRGKREGVSGRAAELVAAVDALRLNVKPWHAEGFETFDVVRGWDAASLEQQRDLVTMALERLAVSEDGETSWTFREGLVQPLNLPALVSPGSFTVRLNDDNNWRHLDTDQLDRAFAQTSPARRAYGRNHHASPTET